MNVKTAVVLGKQVMSSLKEAAGTAKLVSPGRMAVMSENEKVIVVTVEAGSPEDAKLKWLHGNVLKDPDGKIELNVDATPKTVQNLLLAEVPINHGEKTSITRYYEPHMDMVESLGVVFSLPYERSHELARGMMKSKAGDIPDMGSSKGGHW